MNRPSPRTTGILLVAAIALGIVIWPIARSAAGRQVRKAIVAELQPITLRNCTLRRFGSAFDGGYLMCENLMEKIEVAYSYGVGPNDEWGCEVSRRYHVPVHQYDCFDPARPTCEGGQFVFHNECVADRPETDDSRVFDTLENQIVKNGDSGRRTIIKMDIEGAEWDSLAAVPDERLDAMPQLAMELHVSSTMKALRGIRRMKQHFYLVNVHFNNWACTPGSPLPAYAFQVLWVNKRIGIPDPSAPVPAPMSPLNAPDARSRPDCQLP